MNLTGRILTAAAVAAGAGLLALAPVVLPAARPTSTAVDVAAAITRVCPVTDPALAPSTVLLANVEGGLKVRDVADPDTATSVSPGSLSVQEHSRQGIESDVAPGGQGGASAQTSQRTGLERGLSGTSCAVPSNTFWFPAVGASATLSTTLYLSSIDDGGAAVDLTFFGSDGLIPAAGSRSLTVRGHSTQAVVLSSLVKADGLIGLQVQASSGRIAAFTRTRAVQTDPAATAGGGVDWSAGATAPATTVVIPAIPAGAGDRSLRVLNPGARMATYTLEYITSDGATSNPDARVSVAAQGSGTFPITGIAAGHAGAVVLHSDQPVSASVVALADRGDLAVADAQNPFTSAAVLPLAQGGGQSVVELTARQDSDVEITFTDANGTVTADRVRQHLAAGRHFSLAAPKGNTVIARVQVLSGAVYGGVVLTADLDGFAGLTIYPLVRAEGGRTGVDPLQGLG